MMFKSSSAVLSLVMTFMSLFSTAFCVCLPCQIAFRRPNFAEKALFPRAVWTPHITNPTSRAVWIKGQLEMVTWNITDAPPDVSNPTCQIYLAEMAGKNYKTIHLDHPLALECNLNDGNTTIKVPSESWVDPTSIWTVVLMGDSGDHSSPFKIVSSPGDFQ